MANIKKRGDAYQIRVSNGYDVRGKQIVKIQDMEAHTRNEQAPD